MLDESITSRERLLEVIRIMEEQTDEKDMKTIHDIHAFFPESSNVGIGAVRDDLLTLEESTFFPVSAVQEKNGKPKHYYYDGRLFELHELRLLMDAISAAKFIPRKETNRLLMKIRKSTSRRLAKQLNNELYIVSETGHDMSEITAIVQLLHTGIQERQVIAFQYGRFGNDLEFHLSNEGKDYHVKPYGLIWNHDRYYLIAEYIPEGEIRQYRVDRMRSLQLMDESFIPEPDFQLKKYVSNMFHMFGGESISLEVDFVNELINVVIDRFGKEANIKMKGSDRFVLKTQVLMSEGLVQWLLRFGQRVIVIHPKKLVNRMKNEAKSIYENYN